MLAKNIEAARKQARSSVTPLEDPSRAQHAHKRKCVARDSRAEPQTSFVREIHELNSFL